ncbi:MAG: MCP four helix bundle domain-containing protein [Pseudomonadota bacterium]|nr:MCP four helix bundle domain-containing protein [Pseudomonadota bacterium]
MLSRLRLGTKLLLAPLVVLACMACVLCLAWSAIARQGQALDALVQQRAAQTRSAAELAAGARQANAEVYQLISWISASFSQARTDTLVRGIHRRHAAIARNFTTLTRLTAGVDTERALVQQTERAYRVYLASVLDVIELARADQTISANAMIRAERAFDTVLVRLDALTRVEQQQGERAAAMAADEAHTVAILMPAALMAALAAALLVTLAVRCALQEELEALCAAATALGAGDLRAAPVPPGRDEICGAAQVLDAARTNVHARLTGVLECARALGAQAIDNDNALHAQALALSRSVMTFQLDQPPVVSSLLVADLPRKRKGMPGPVRPGHPYLRLAVSRR